MASCKRDKYEWRQATLSLFSVQELLEAARRKVDHVQVFLNKASKKDVKILKHWLDGTSTLAGRKVNERGRLRKAKEGT
jgi:hypothetical protein